MTDEIIIELFWKRSEKAIEETNKAYGKYLNYISNSILNDEEDAEEVVNDTYLKAWNNIPPNKPDPLKAFLGKITRQLSINRLRERNAQKRGRGQYEAVLDELYECIPSGDESENAVDKILLSRILNDFLRTLGDEPRRIFIKRYWYMMSVSNISSELSLSESKVKMTLMRTREKLKKKLEEEGINV